MAETTKTFVERLFAEHGTALQAFWYRRVHRHPDAAPSSPRRCMCECCGSRIWGVIRNPEAYLYTVASNLAKEHARNGRRDRDAVDVDDPLMQKQLAELPAFAGQLDTEQRIKRLRQVLHRLPPKCHAAVMLQYRHGLSYEEIAQRLGVRHVWSRNI